jgi:pyruvate formate-lyase/glycerol dehydratase family glycyl radical enzyme
MAERTTTNLLAYGLLQLMAANYNLRPSLREELKTRGGWMNFTVGVRTLDDTVRQSIRFRGGFAFVLPYIPSSAETVLEFKSDDVLKRMLRLTPEEVMNLLLKSEMRLDGNLSVMSKFNYFMSLLLDKKNKKMVAERKKEDLEQVLRDPEPGDTEGGAKLDARMKTRMRGEKSDAVRFLDDPYLSEYSLDDFPRLKKFLDIHMTRKPEICAERPKLLTDWFRENGFENDRGAKPWSPELRQSLAFKHMMEKRKPIVRKDDLLAGTTTTKEIGVVVYPDTMGTMIWGELKSVPDRILNPYDISEETRGILHHDVFPFWEKRNVREAVRQRYGAPLCQRMDERFAVYFLWKTAALSHTIPDFPKLLSLGTSGIIEEINTALEREIEWDRRNTLSAMINCLEGLNAYAENLSGQAWLEAERETDPARKEELEKMSEVCARVPKYPARTLREAMQSIWTAWIALHMENTNAGLSIGRLDQWLQPFFIADLARIFDPETRGRYIKRAIELAGCFFMRCTDHLPLVPDIGNFLFGGSSSDQAITLGGTTPDGGTAVNDMTYIFLKVTEMLRIRDPNVNARYNPDVNSDTYLKRLCEVNLIAAATPSMHNDKAVMASLAEFDYPIAHLRDWSATGCVEPTLSGKHIGHTNCMMMNMVAALEMALNNGRHPLMDWEVGPKSGDPADGGFETFDDFFKAFETQYVFLIDNSCEYNNMLGEAHAEIRPTPLLSSMIDGCIKSGKDVTRGGARYNTSGAACVGLADVTDSLVAIKKLVFDEKSVSFADLRKAMDENFENDAALRSKILNRVPKFGSGSAEALEMAERITKFTHDTYGEHTNFRGGRYTAGFWSMSNHVAFGSLTGALPSGRLAGKPFTPGLTPSPAASDNLLDPIRDVASLRPEYMNNNIAFNVKVVPAPHDSHERTVENMFNYVKTYFELGGMQMQMNVVTSAILRDAMKNPENYRNLLVRISGYNAYFVTLNRDMQRELIERAEFGV